VPVSSCERQEKVPNASAAQKAAARHLASATGTIDMGDLRPKQFVNVECCASGLRPLERL
jgi:hypothetical protein